MIGKKLLYDEPLLNRLSEATLLVDSTALIDASSKPVFMDFLFEIAQSDCVLATIPSVLYEFKRGAKNLMQLGTFNKIISDLDIAVIPQIEMRAGEEKSQIFTAVYNLETMNGRKEKGPSYTDSLLCLTLYLYAHTNIKLLTTNYKDVPQSLFDREDLIVFDTGKDVRTAAIYSLSVMKFESRLGTFK